MVWREVEYFLFVDIFAELWRIVEGESETKLIDMCLRLSYIRLDVVDFILKVKCLDQTHQQWY